MMSKKGIKIKQFDITDCGAACLASVCAYYGLQFPIARIRQYAFTDQKGTNILGLIEAANKLGLSAKECGLSLRHCILFLNLLLPMSSCTSSFSIL